MSQEKDIYILGIESSCDETAAAVVMLGTYAAAVIVLFAVFYPVLSGQPVDAEFVLRYLRWFPSWVLTAG